MNRIYCTASNSARVHSVMLLEHANGSGAGHKYGGIEGHHSIGAAENLKPVGRYRQALGRVGLAVTMATLTGTFVLVSPASADPYYYSVQHDYNPANGNYFADGATGTNALAAGVDATAAGDHGIAVGAANANTADSISVGRGSSVNADPQNANNNGAGGIAIGQGATVTGGSASAPSSALGQGAKATGASATALGGKAVASGTATTAVGTGASASGNNSSAIGANAQATAANAVALGNDSVADRANSVSVGSVGKESQITNVKAGTANTDAVNVSQLKGAQEGNVSYASNPNGTTNYNQVTLGNGQAPGGTTISNVAPGLVGTDAVNLNQLNSGLAASNHYTDQRFDKLDHDIGSLRQDAFAGIASALATANLPQPYSPGARMVAAGVGNYQGQSAVSVGLSSISDNGHWILKVSGTTNTRGQGGVGAGAGYQW